MWNKIMPRLRSLGLFDILSIFGALAIPIFVIAEPDNSRISMFGKVLLIEKSSLNLVLILVFILCLFMWIFRREYRSVKYERIKHIYMQE